MQIRDAYKRKCKNYLTQNILIFLHLQCVRGNKQPDVCLEASVDGKKKKTATVPRSCDPVWEQGFIFLVSNPETGVLHIKVTYLDVINI